MKHIHVAVLALTALALIGCGKGNELARQQLAMLYSPERRV